ncbi:MAG: efflux RND transporter periplasmic adaptor subunit [Janthinobacterium lividum]
MTDLHHPQPLPPARTLDRRRQWLLLAVAAGALIVSLLVSALGRWTSAPAHETAAAIPPGTFRATPDQLRQLQTMTVGDSADDRRVNATGIISVDEDHSTPVLLPYSGQVAQVYVHAGERVAAGQPLLAIASPDVVEARNALAAAQAQRATAAAQLKIATDASARQQAIYQTAGGALKDYRQSQSDLVAAQSVLASATSALAAAQDKLALFGQGGGTMSTRSVYRSPVAGTVATRDVAPGQYVGAGGDKPVMTIADLSRVWLIAQLAETDAAAVHVGDRVRVTTPAYPGREFDARIDNVAAQLDPATHRLPVRATVANPDGALKPQMFASFAISRATASSADASAIRVPSAAVIHEGDSARVWLIGANGVLRAQPVQVSDSTDTTDTIASGLKRGDRIVTAGALFVNEAGSGG